ncbi:10169_t:CDS:1, partial [Scutellospora calospora]
LPVERLYSQSNYPVYRKQRNSCVWCRFKNTAEQGKRTEKSPLSQVWCTTYNVSLCLNKQRLDCFIVYHE